MKFLVRQKIFSFADKFNITDSIGVPKLQVEGKFFTIGKKLDIYDMENNHLIYVKQEIFRVLSEYLLYKDGEIVAKVKRNLTLFKPKVTIESVYGDFTIDGSVLRYNFKLIKDGDVVAEINKKILSLSDTYEVDVHGDNEVFILALVIVVDQIFHDNSQRNSS